MPNKKEFFKQLNREREEIYKKIVEVFSVGAVEAHVFGSVARGNTDAFSDIDIWFTYKDEDFEKVKSNRVDNYKKVDNLLQFVEPPQNAPINGICSSLKYLTDNENIQVVDIYLCPLSTSMKNPEAKKLFGVDLPIVENMEYNPQKVEVDSDYRINFFSSFIFGTIKKLIRKEENPLEAVIVQYEKLGSQYGYKTEKLESKDQNLNTLLEVIEKTKKVASDNQEYVLKKFEDFAKKVLAPKVYLLCGLPGSGKSTWSEKFVKENPNTVWYKLDKEFFKKHKHSFYGDKFQEYEDEIKKEILEKVKVDLENGKDVILDYGFWKKADRDKYKKISLNLGAEPKLLYFKQDSHILLERLKERNSKNLDHEHIVTKELFSIFINKFEVPNSEGEIME